MLSRPPPTLPPSDPPATTWNILPAYLVRLAGFAHARLDVLCCAAAAQAEGALAEAAAARLAVGRALDEAIAQERYADHPMFDDPAVRKAFGRHVKHARAFARQLASAPVPGEAFAEIVRVIPRVAERAAAVERAHAAWLAAAGELERVFADDFERARRALRELYRDDRLQEAVFLESPEAFERVQQLLATDGARNARARQRERLAAMYAQRFCAKNDSNAICGPVGVGYVAPLASADARIEVTVEDARRETYYSHWAAQRLLDEVGRRAGDAARVTLRLHPMARVEDAAVAWCAMNNTEITFTRRYRRSELEPAVADLLRALIRPHTRAELADLARAHALELDEITAFIAELVEARLVLQGPIIPPGLFRPLRAVAEELAAWPPSEARTWGLAEVEAAERLVAAFARAPLAARRELLAELSARFEASTGAAATRNQGRHYADRSVIHEDSFVEVDVELGTTRRAIDTALPAMIAVLELPLELGRERVRAWFRARFGEGVRVSALEAHRAFDEDQPIERPCGTPREAAIAAAIARVHDVIARAGAGAVDGVARLTSAELRGALAELVAPTHPGYVSADVMLRRVAGGATELVLAEVHGFFWLPTCLLDVLPPDQRERVLGQMRAAMSEMARGRPTAESVFLHTQATDRRFPLATTDLLMLVPSERVDAVDLGALDLRLMGAEFQFVRRDHDGEQGEQEIVPLVAYSRYLFLQYTGRLAPLFDDHSDRFFPDGLLPEPLRAGDVPRLVLDDVVFQRRLWRRRAADVRAALTATTEGELFRRAQELRRTIGCGARVFVSVSGELKPVMLDFHNVFLLEALVNLLERRPDDATVKFSEMMPAPDELVCRGPDGLRTAELRMGFYRV